MLSTVHSGWQLLLELIKQRTSAEGSQPGQAFLGWTWVENGILLQRGLSPSRESSAALPGGLLPDLTCSVTPTVRWVRLTDTWSSLMLRKVTKRDGIGSLSWPLALQSWGSLVRDTAQQAGLPLEEGVGCFWGSSFLALVS